MPEWIEKGINHYFKQLRNHQLIAIKNSNKIDEGKKLLTKATGTIIALDEKGENITSIDFASKINYWRQNGDISFIIGGADGLSDEVRSVAKYIISFSKMTMPHSLARLVLVEQLYRANSILNNHPYHREG